MTPERRELFVYYRVAEADAVPACAAVLEWQQLLCAAHPALTARLMRRPGAEDGCVTLMEHYRAEGAECPAGVDAKWQARIETAARVLHRWQQGARHVECFETLA
jgi:Domain of unknown function (DUF4936)